MQQRVTTLLLLAASLVHAQKSVVYRLEFATTNDTCTLGENSDPLTLTASDFSTVMDIMEQAAREGGQRYEFSATFSDGDGDVGYVIDSISGVANNAPCYWSFYIRSGEMELMPNLGVSDFVPGDNFEVIMRYEARIGTPTIMTMYIIDYPDPFCIEAAPLDAINVVTRSGSSALDVMEEAVAQGGRAYNFSVSYGAIEESFGYVIQQLNGVAKNGSCSWTASVTNPGGIETLLTVPVSQYILPDTGYTLTLRYVEPEIPSVTTRGSATKCVLDISLTSLLLIICITLGV